MSEKGGTDRTLVMWAVFAVLFLCTTLALAGCLVFLVMNNPRLKWTLEGGMTSSQTDGDVTTDGGTPVTKGGSTGNTDKDSNVFAELQEHEINNILNFLKTNTTLELTDASKATTTDNYVFMMEVVQPNKEDVLKYLQTGQNKPVRKALVMILEGAKTKPGVLEIHVSPLPAPTMYDVHDEISWKKRPRLAPAEVKQMESFLKDQTGVASQFMLDKFGFKFSGCTEDCLEWTFSTPGVPYTGSRNTWVVFRQPYAGSALHALPLYLLVNDASRNSADWTIDQVVYLRQNYSSLAALADASSVPSIADKMPVNLTAEERSKTSMKQNFETAEGPETNGKGRYILDGQRVKYFKWDFDFTHKVSNGLQLYNIRFDSVRIVYELSIQGIMSFYSGINPFMMHTRYLENLNPLGFSVSSLTEGIDCPLNADYFDGYYYSPDSGKVEKHLRYVCVFEHDRNVPLKRHKNGFYSQNNKGYYGGLPGKALVVRSIQTFLDIDYIFDYIFHGNGAIEAKFYTTGYVLGTFWSDIYTEEEEFGYPISENQLSPLAEHFVNYKVDIDVQGTSNRHAAIDIDYYSGENPYFPGEEIIERKLTRKIIQREKESALEYDLSNPKFLLFFNHTSRNRFVKHRAYRLILNKVAKHIMQPKFKWDNAVTWARYQLAVTLRKESEGQSSSIYDALDPYEPKNDFYGYINDNEPIQDEDLVAWVTVGDYRLPSTSDVPLASTLDTQGGFQLVPFNYFEEDPSKSHPDWVYKEAD